MDRYSGVIASVLAAVVFLDHFLAALPPERVKANSTLQLLRDVVHAIASSVWRKPPPPAAAAALLFVLLPSLAHADDTPVAAPVAVPATPPQAVTPAAPVLVLPAPTLTVPDPVPTPIPAKTLAEKFAATDAQLHALADKLGVPMPTALPPAFLDSTAGKAITYVVAIVGVGLSVAQAGISIAQEFR